MASHVTAFTHTNAYTLAHTILHMGAYWWQPYGNSYKLHKIDVSRLHK